MANVSMHELFKVGAHFGHQRRVWNPRMHPFVYGVRNNIHIIDLEKTAPLMNDALNFISSIAAQNRKVLFVGTKRVARNIIREQAERCGMPYVSHRWLGGMLTNFKTIKQSINRLKELESQKANGIFDRLTKKEALLRTREMTKLERNLSGIKNLEGMPDVIFVVDVKHERIAIKEAKSLPKKVDIVGIVDTNSSTEDIDYIIPANDDAARAVALYVTKIADAILEAHATIVPANLDADNSKEEAPVAPEPAAAEPKQAAPVTDSEQPTAEAKPEPSNEASDADSAAEPSTDSQSAS